MEKVKKVKSPRKLETDFGLRVLAIVIAVIIWLILSITQYPTINKTITNVPVDFSLDGTAVSEKGLSVLNYKDITVDVEIKGMNYEIGSYGSNDLVATVNLDGVSKEGTYNLDIDVKSSHSSDKVTIVSVTPETVEVTFDRISSDTFKVSTEAPLVNAGEGLTLKETTASPTEIEVEGAENDLKKIERVVAKYSKSMTLSEDTTVQADEVIFYDADDNVLDSSDYTVSDSKALEINFVVYKKKTVNLYVEFSDCPSGFDTSTLPYSLSEESIQVITPNLDDVDTEDVKLGTVSLKDVNLGSTFTFDADKMLAVGDINQTGISEVMVSFDSEGYVSKTIALPKTQIKIQNSPTGKTVTVETKQIPEVTVIGPEDVVNNLTEEDLTATLNLSDVSNSGSLTHEISISVPGHDDVWCYGDYEVQLVIADAAVSSESEAEE